MLTEYEINKINSHGAIILIASSKLVRHTYKSDTYHISTKWILWIWTGRLQFKTRSAAVAVWCQKPLVSEKLLARWRLVALRIVHSDVFNMYFMLSCLPFLFEMSSYEMLMSAGDPLRFEMGETREIGHSFPWQVIAWIRAWNCLKGSLLVGDFNRCLSIGITHWLEWWWRTLLP